MMKGKGRRDCVPKQRADTRALNRDQKRFLSPERVPMTMMATIAGHEASATGRKPRQERKITVSAIGSNILPSTPVKVSSGT